MDEFLWVEKYRPKKIEECILSNDLRKTFSNIVAGGELQNMMLTGTAGTGKTTVARALCNELDLDYIVINGSEESGIDTLRNKIKQFASSVSLSGGYKVVILDEADYLNPQSTQPALRGFIEEFSNNCRFILTCNFKNRLIEPLHSRCAVVEFNTNKKQLAGLASQFMARLKSILDNEGVTYNEKVIAELIIRHAPDWRRVIGECKRYGRTGEIPAAILIGNRDESIAEVITHLKSKDFKSMRAWVSNNAALDTAAIFRKIYDVLSDHADASGIPSAVLILADYQFKAAFVADRELNMVAAMTELMANVTWKK